MYDAEIESIMQVRSKVLHLHQRRGIPQPGDWLYEHEEPGQTFEEYLTTEPNTARGEKKYISVFPLGEFTPGQHRIIQLATELLGLYFCLPCRMGKTITTDEIPHYARRVHPSWKIPQLLTKYVMHDVLTTHRQDDDVAVIAFTASDLWPGVVKGQEYNFVYGQASITKRVGVWSIYRKGNADGSAAAFAECLLATIKTATHEVGHMISMRHCIKYICALSGHNSDEESQQLPLEVCPECVCKVLWATQANALDRYHKLAAFCAQNSLHAQRVAYEHALQAVQSNTTTEAL